MEAYVLLHYEDTRTAKTIANAVSPDNFKTLQGFVVETTWRGRTVSTKIMCCEKLETLLSTIDDLLACVSTAEKTIQTLHKKAY